MITDEDVRSADDAARDSQENARRIRQEAIDEHYEAAYNEKQKAETLNND